MKNLSSRLGLMEFVVQKSPLPVNVPEPTTTQSANWAATVAEACRRISSASNCWPVSFRLATISQCGRKASRRHFPQRGALRSSSEHGAFRKTLEIPLLEPFPRCSEEPVRLKEAKKVQVPALIFCIEFQFF